MYLKDMLLTYYIIYIYIYYDYIYTCALKHITVVYSFLLCTSLLPRIPSIPKRNARRRRGTHTGARFLSFHRDLKTSVEHSWDL